MLANDELPGLYLVVTGTRDFFEGYKGLKGLRRSTSGSPRASTTTRGSTTCGASGSPAALHRGASAGGRAADPRPLPCEESRAQWQRRVSDAFLSVLVAAGDDRLRRQGLARAADRSCASSSTSSDRVDQHADYDPAVHYELELEDDDADPRRSSPRRGVAVPLEPEDGREPPSPSADSTAEQWVQPSPLPASPSASDLQHAIVHDLGWRALRPCRS